MSYKIRPKDPVVVRLQSIPSALENYDMRISFLRSRYILALDAAFHSAISTWKSKIIIQTQPKVGVFLKTDVKKGELHFVPLSTSIVTQSAATPAMDKAIKLADLGDDFTHPKTNADMVAFVLPPKAVFPPETAGAKAVVPWSSVIIPFWLVRATSKEDDANVEIKETKITMDIGVKKIVTMTIPYYTNSSALDKDEELFW